MSQIISPPTKPITLVATIGGQPQVATFALDTLLAAGWQVADLFAIYLNNEDERLTRARARLASQFSPDKSGWPPYRSIGFHSHPIRARAHTPRDIYDESDADTVWRAVHNLIARLKTGGHPIHICISGGRRILSLLTMSAAMLHFGHQDVLWHMYTPPELIAEARDGALMHLPPNSGFRLIRVPMMPWGSYFPALQELSRPLEGDDVLARPRRAMDAVESARAGAVRARLTGRQADVLRELAAGHTPQQTAARLGIKLSTVDTHKTVILAECRNAWGLPEDVRLDYRFLWEKFGPPEDPL